MEGLECWSQVLKAGSLRKDGDVIKLNPLGRKQDSYGRWKVEGGAEGSLLGVSHSHGLAQGPDLGLQQQRCKKGPLWKRTSEVNERGKGSVPAPLSGGWYVPAP